MIYRTHNLGELRKENIGQTVTLSGWVDTTRDFGGLTFVDLRDREGKTQVVFDVDVAPKDVIENAQKLKNETVIRIVGVVKERQSKNPNIPTGDIEVFATELKVLNGCDVLPFQITGTEDNLSENIRLKYRYLDIRRPKMLNNLRMRHKMIMAIRNYMDEHGFIDVDTPLLNKSTPSSSILLTSLSLCSKTIIGDLSSIFDIIFSILIVFSTMSSLKIEPSVSLIFKRLSSAETRLGSKVSQTCSSSSCFF